jgi:hypothetical protein
VLAVGDPFTDDAERRDRHDDEGTGVQGLLRVAAEDVGLAGGDQQPPVRRGLVGAQAQVRQGGEVDQRVAEGDRGLGEDDGGQVRQQVTAQIATGDWPCTTSAAT